MENILPFYLPANSTAYNSPASPYYYNQDQAQYDSFTPDLPANGYSAANNIPRSLAANGHCDEYAQNNTWSIPRSQDDMLTHGRHDHDAWREELDGGVPAQNFAPSVRPFGLSDGTLAQYPLSPPPPSHSPSESSGSPSNSTRVVGSEALLRFSQNRRKKPAIYKCDFKNCNQDFTTKANQTHHKNSHWGRKPFSCSLGCGKVFGVRHSMKRHLKTCICIKNPFKQPSGLK